MRACVYLVRINKFIYFSVVAANPDLYSRLRGLLNEVRGELGRTSRGNKEARERLLTSKKYTEHVCISVFHVNTQNMSVSVSSL